MYRVVVLLLILCPYRLLPQTTANDFELLSTAKGLSQGMVFDILQGHDGFLWLATKDGLNRYDGYNFKIFAHDPFARFSISNNEVRQLFEDKQGRIWINYPQGLDIFVPASGRFFHLSSEHLPIYAGSANAGSPLTFACTPDGAVWITDRVKLWRIEVPENLLNTAAKTGNAAPRLPYTTLSMPQPEGLNGTVKPISVFYSKHYQLLVGTTHGLYRLDTATQTLLPLALPGQSIIIAGEDEAGSIYLKVLEPSSRLLIPAKPADLYHTRSKFDLCTWDGQSVTPINVRFMRVDKCQFDYQGNVWTLQEHTLRKWRPEALKSGEKPAFEWAWTDPVIRTPDFYVPSFTVDRSGIAWVGTSGYGVIKINPQKPKFSSYLSYYSQRRVLEDPQGNLFTTMNHEWLFTDKQFGRSISNPWFFQADGVQVLITVFDTAGNGWGGNGWTNIGQNRLYRIAANTGAVRHFPWGGMGLMLDRNKKLISVSEEGLLQFDPATEKSRLIPFDKPQTLIPSYTYSQLLYEDPTGDLWIFAFEGLVKATHGNNGYQFAHFKNNPDDRASLSNNTVFCVVADPLDPARYLWVGTKGGGLNRLDKQNGTFQHFKTEQGLPDNVVYGILSAGNYLWLSTNRGLCRFHVRDETVKNFTVADGLQDNEFNQSSYLKTKDGTLIFGGVNGLTVFHPDSLRFNEFVPQARIVRVTVDNIPLDAASQNVLKLAHNQNFISFEFAALEFSNPGQNRYRYQLVRHNTFRADTEMPWQDLGVKNSVQFANLQPGDYTFRVLGSNNDGLWSQAPDEFRFFIQPPWWASWWALLFYLTAVAALVGLLYRYQLRRRLEHQETHRLRELDDFKSRFFTNITHEFRTPLTVILGISEQWLKEETDEPKRHKLGLIKRNGVNLLRLINQILDLAKIESSSLKINYVHGDVSAYLRYIVESLHSFANAQNVMLRMEIPGSQGRIMMDYDPERLLQIVHNLLSNAIKFTPSGGQVLLTALPSGTELQLSVADTGAGISPEELPLIFDRFYQANNLEKAKAGGTGIGLALTKELVKALGGEISVKSEVGKGTTFTVTLPIANKANQNQGLPNFQSLVNLSEPDKQPISANSPPRPGATTKNQILLIEDNPDVVEYLVACLREHYALSFAYNGRAGIEMALETIPDLIISDVMMPEKDGFEVCKTLKNDERTSHIPIVLLTAKAGVENRIAGLRRGADAYLSKPFHQEELLVTLGNLLEVRKKLQAKYQTQPGQPLATSHPADPEDAFIQKVYNAVLEHSSDPAFSVDALCRALAMSQPQLHRKLTALTGKNATLFIRAVRLAQAKTLLLAGQKNVSEVAFAVGFDDPKYFSRVFAEAFGVPPSKI
ncbi:MAG: response regulator [Saprospiraceae bacterium]|nr:response regulator [Saprospiraceae bacterium]